jgi:uncharacterized protein YjbI with pentapeptide repeats
MGPNRLRPMRWWHGARPRGGDYSPNGGPHLPSIAAKADDLEAIKRAIEDAAGVSAGLWLSYLFVLFYLAVAAGAVTQTDLLLENPVKLPFLNIELPLLAFFVLAPLLFLITHAYTLVHFVLLAKKALRFHDELFRQIPDSSMNPRASEVRRALRQQLPSNIFVQFLAGPDDIRYSGFGRLLKLIAWTTLVVGPISLLLLLQIQFLPYHDFSITWIHRVAILVDMLLIWWLWRKIVEGAGDLRGYRSWKSWAKAVPALVVSAFAVLFSWTVATIPDEWQESHPPALGLIPTNWQPIRDLPSTLVTWLTRAPGADTSPTAHSAATLKSWFELTKPASLHEVVFGGGHDTDVNDTTGRPTSLVSNRLVLPGFNIYEALKIDDPKKIEWKEFSFRLRSRHLEHAILWSANLTRVDLTGAFMNGARLDSVQFGRASLDGAHLEGASINGAYLEGASLKGAHLQEVALLDAHLEGATLDDAQLQGALGFGSARLDGASLKNAQLQGVNLSNAKLQGVDLSNAKLQGASLFGAFLEFASLWDAHLEAAELGAAHLKGADLWGAQLQGADLSGAELDNGTSLQGAFLWRAKIGITDRLFWKRKRVLVEELHWGPEFADVTTQPWTQATYHTLRQKIERLVLPAKERLGRTERRDALARVAILDCDRHDETLASCNSSIDLPNAAKDSQRAIESVDQANYSVDLATDLMKFVCSGEPGIYVLRRLLVSQRLRPFLSPAWVTRLKRDDCAISRLLTDADRAALADPRFGAN